MQGLVRGVHRVMTHPALVRTLNGRAKHKARIRYGFKFDWLRTLLKYDRFSGRYQCRAGEQTFMRGYPGDVVAPRRLEAPTFTCFQSDIEIRETRRCP